MPTRAEQMQQILKTLVTNTPDVEAAAIVSIDGLVLASVLPSGTDEDRISAMAAALLSRGFGPSPQGRPQAGRSAGSRPG